MMLSFLTVLFCCFLQWRMGSAWEGVGLPKTATRYYRLLLNGKAGSHSLGLYSRRFRQTVGQVALVGREAWISPIGC